MLSISEIAGRLKQWNIILSIALLIIGLALVLSAKKMSRAILKKKDKTENFEDRRFSLEFKLRIAGCIISFFGFSFGVFI